MIPSTGLSDLILIDHQCKTCQSRHGAKWIPDGKLFGGENGLMTKMKLEHYYMHHCKSIDVEGFYHIIDACLRADVEACAQDLVVYAIMLAVPRFTTIGDGYIGLGTGAGYGNDTDSSFLHQMYDNGMIKSKIFGVHTHMFNSTEDPSQIRFGGFNEELFKQGDKLFMIDTPSKSTWEIKFDSAGFHTKELWNKWHALIDPGYPYIALPY